jgi:2-polyprenyl-6-methoxyphenol hydroxylase-like FAD-dependent oxidoreductase
MCFRMLTMAGDAGGTQPTFDPAGCRQSATAASRNVPSGVAEHPLVFLGRFILSGTSAMYRGPAGEVWVRPARVYINFPTNDGPTCVAMQAPVAGFHGFRSDIEGNFYQVLDDVPDLAERVRAGSRVDQWYGTADLDNFFRTSCGPGRALVGDAGFHKNPVLAQGISDAFRDAEIFTNAIDAGFAGRIPPDKALRDYEQRRNDATLAGYEQNCAAASFMPPPPEILVQRAAIHSAQRSVL